MSHTLLLALVGDIAGAKAVWMKSGNEIPMHIDLRTNSEGAVWGC
jgi:hypothetical protein